MSMDLVRGELERLFSLDEMMALSKDLMGFDPGEIGGSASKASFARALTDRCAELDAVEALVDALLASRTEIDPRVREIGQRGAGADELKPGDAFGPYTVTRKLGDGPRGAVYAAKRDGHDVALKILRPAATSDARALHRFLTQVRLAAQVKHANLPERLEAGRVGRRAYVAYAAIDGQPLSARIARTGPLHINEAKAVVRGVLAALGALHKERLAHGAVKLENILVTRGEGGVPKPVLVDFAADRVGGSSWASAGVVKASAPEQLRGRAADVKGDLYGFGVSLFELLTGKPPFAGETGVDLAIAQLTLPAPLASAMAPRGWVSKELDDLCQRLLERAAGARPKDVAAVLEALEPLGRAPAKDGKKTLSDEEITERIDAVIADPSDAAAALALETAVEQGADPKKVAEAFTLAESQVDEGEGDDGKDKAKATRKSLLFRAARVLESAAKAPGEAEAVYARIGELDPGDETAFLALEELRRALGKHEELVEMLLERSEKAESASEKARALHSIGQLYARELDDKEQAVFAFAQALAQDAQNDGYASDLERASGEDMKLWAEALQILSQVTTDPDLAAETKTSLFLRLGRWYSEKIARPDMGLPCFQAVLANDPANEDALDGMGHVFRRAQQWAELGQVLLRRADRAPTPGKARDLRSEAAELLEAKLSDPERARDLFEQVVHEDPGHAKASEALARIYQKLDDHAGYAKLLERRAEALRGEERSEVLCKIAELHEDRMNDLVEATRRYEAVLEGDPGSLTALRGLDRIFSRSGRYKELLENLERQIHLSPTPRQKIKLYERIAGIQDEEYLDHGKAAEALESILRIDGSHEGALSALVRHYRALDRWEDVAALYEKSVKIVTDENRQVELLLTMGRVLEEHVGSPQRARHAYERVLEIDPHHERALESLAIVRAATGDAAAALAAIESLAAKATTADAKAELWLRAARLLEEKGDRDGAIERYKAALDTVPGHAIASPSLRAAYLARGDATSAVELIAREIDGAEGNLSKARLYGEMAVLLHQRLKDDERAAECATKAVDLDPTSMMGLMITGDIAFAAGRFLEAVKSYESLASRAEALPKDERVRVLVQFVDALAKSGSTEKAIGNVKMMLALAPESPIALSRAARVTLDAGDGKEAARLYADLIERFGAGLEPSDRADALLHLGEARVAAGDAEGAIAPLREAADLAPDAPEPLQALCAAFEAMKDWEEVVRIKTQRLDVASGDERSNLLLEIGEVLASKKGDRTRAAKSFVAALDERPEDRRILTRLMQLYSEEKDWPALVDVVLKLASKVEDKKQKAKYMHTAAIVSARQIGDLDRAATFFDEVLELDPTLEKALKEAIDIRRDKGDHEGLERLLKVQLEQAHERADSEKMLAMFEALGDLYKNKLGWTNEAIDAYEAAQTMDPDNEQRAELLGELYSTDPAAHLDKAVAAQEPILKNNPYKPEPYKLMRRLYTEAKRADGAFCVCQALVSMNAASPDEERFFRRMRPEGAAAAQDRLTADDWSAYLAHEDGDPLLTQIFAIVEPAVFRKNGQPLEALGYQAAYAVDLAVHPYPMSQTIHYAAGVLGMDAPPTFQNPNDGGGVSFLHAHTPSIVLGASALAPEIPTQAAAFVAARHLTYYRPGYYVRHLVPTGTGLRAWLFAAIKLIVPAFPVANELEAAVRDNGKAIEAAVLGPQRDQLASAVTKLLQGGAIDLKKWVAAVDLTADRAGFVIANDLELAQEMVKAADEASAAVAQKDRLKELLLFSVSEAYFALRQRLGINIDG
jgi:tetratricopeptide (TPR) repeat protein